MASHTNVYGENVIYRDVNESLDQIKRRPIEGLYSCIYGRDVAEPCFRAPPIRSDYDPTASRARAIFEQWIAETLL